MGKRCFVPLCKSGYDTCLEKVSVFRVPKDRVDVWRAIIPRSDRKLSIKDNVCEKHFSPDFIIREVNTETYSYSLRYPRLSENAVPTIFPGYTTTYIKTELPDVSDEGNITGEEVTLNSDAVATATSSSFLSDIFKDLWDRSVNVQLPSQAWATHYIPGKIDMICFSEMIASFEEEINCTVRKKIVLTETSLDFYVFNYSVTDNENIASHTIQTVSTLEETLQQFNSLSVCLGGPKFSNCLGNFSSTSYKKDKIARVWRHKNCPLVLSNKEGILNICGYCNKAQ